MSFQNSDPRIPGFAPPPLVSELFRLLPKAGESFTKYDREKFLRAAESIFDVVYAAWPKEGE